MERETPFSFHCMICYEEFHPSLRYPVVLPCGHTYVCNMCADRLDKCMECRTPLYLAVGKAHSTGMTIQSPPRQQRSSWTSARSGNVLGSMPSSSSDARPQPPVKKRLPLPKNVVLLSLIEATELTSLDVQKKFSSSSRGASEDSADEQMHGSPSLLVESASEEEEEKEKIKVGFSLAVGVAGTYAVSAPEGLDIFPSRPSTVELDTASALDGDVDTLVRFFHLDKKSGGDSPGKLETPNNKGDPHRDLARLAFGDRVQVVSMDGEWAKLARGYGFVRATKGNLVKVGGSVDRACKLEALLRSLSYRRKELRMEQSRVDNHFIRLMNDLQISLQNDEDLTVICAQAFGDAPAIQEERKQDIQDEDKGASKGESAPAASPPKRNANEQSTVTWREELATAASLPERNENETEDGQNSMVSSDAALPSTSHSSGLVCFAGSVFDSDESRDDNRQILGSMSHPFLNNCTDHDHQGANVLFPSASHPSPSAMREGARAWRERQSEGSGSAIDFRTGMSGHTALLSSHAHSHAYLEPVSSHHDVFPKMSAHTGLPLTGNYLRGIFDSVMRSPSRSTTQDSEVPHSGSM